MMSTKLRVACLTRYDAHAQEARLRVDLFARTGLTFICFCFVSFSLRLMAGLLASSLSTNVPCLSLLCKLLGLVEANVVVFPVSF